MGTASAKAQALKQVITTFDKFVGTDNRIYLKVDGNKVLGLLKVGERNLFYRDYVFRFLNEIGTIKEMKPTCVLDFYVHESCQRSGVGKVIIERI
jgi:alpha-tubulin N-acetyltransferase 1